MKLPGVGVGHEVVTGVGVGRLFGNGVLVPVPGWNSVNIGYYVSFRWSHTSSESVASRPRYIGHERRSFIMWYKSRSSGRRRRGRGFGVGLDGGLGRGLCRGRRLGRYSRRGPPLRLWTLPLSLSRHPDGVRLG